MWVAPGHSFDRNTVAVLKKIGVSAISDGFGLAPYADPEGIFWVPQQLWEFRWRPFGVWTVCFHVNSWGQEQAILFQRALENYGSAITHFSSVASRYRLRRQGAMDRAYATAHSAGRCFRSRLTQFCDCRNTPSHRGL
jgi:hypothetical protein